MRRNFKELKGAHPNSDIWIIGGGASLSYVDPSFFDGKLTMGLNESFCRYPRCTYYARKDGSGWQGRDVLKHIREVSPESKLIVSDYNGTVVEWGKNVFGVGFDYWYFNHHCGHGEVNLDIFPRMLNEGVFPGGIGTMGIATALAAYLGAKNVILCGNDTVMLDGKSYYPEYADSYQCPTGHQECLNWTNRNSLPVIGYLREQGLNVHGLNAFVNMRFEGHSYTL